MLLEQSLFQKLAGQGREKGRGGGRKGRKEGRKKGKKDGERERGKSALPGTFLSVLTDVSDSLAPNMNTGGKKNTQEFILSPKVLAGFSPFFPPLILVHFL